MDECTHESTKLTHRNPSINPSTRVCVRKCKWTTTVSFRCCGRRRRALWASSSPTRASASTLTSSAPAAPPRAPARASQNSTSRRLGQSATQPRSKHAVRFVLKLFVCLFVCLFNCLFVCLFVLRVACLLALPHSCLIVDLPPTSNPSIISSLLPSFLCSWWLHEPCPSIRLRVKIPVAMLKRPDADKLLALFN